MHDNDGKYSKPFLAKLESFTMKPMRTAIRSPNTVALVERFVQTIKQECLDHFIAPCEQCGSPRILNMQFASLDQTRSRCPVDKISN
ncbi:hypothetical protein SH449x_004151 [Pirellulaceae bacterium SH449]